MQSLYCFTNLCKLLKISMEGDDVVVDKLEQADFRRDMPAARILTYVKDQNSLLLTGGNLLGSQTISSRA